MGFQYIYVSVSDIVLLPWLESYYQHVIILSLKKRPNSYLAREVMPPDFLVL